MSPSPYVLLPLGIVLGFVMGLTGATAAVLVPTFVLGCGLSQTHAQGTSLALTLSPTQWPAIWTFHRAGNVEWRLIGWLLPGVLLGSWLGARVANYVSPDTLRAIFGAFFVFIGGYALVMLTTRSVARALAMAGTLAAISIAMALTSRWMETRAAARAI